MINMSFYNGTLNRVKAKEYIQGTNKRCVYTVGLAYRHPTTHRVPITKERAMQIIDVADLLDIKEERQVIHLNSYTGNDMW